VLLAWQAAANILMAKKLYITVLILAFPLGVNLIRYGGDSYQAWRSRIYQLPHIDSKVLAKCGRMRYRFN
ncbi:hypothetical protein MKX01_018291, partial [Papaver californicum]